MRVFTASWLLGCFLVGVSAFAQERDLCAVRQANVIEVPISSRLVNGRLPNDGGLGDKQIALTFDDGPIAASTLSVLNSLKECGVRAHFFMVGHNMRSLERDDASLRLIQRMIADGHEVGSHSMTHDRRRKLGVLAERDFDGNREVFDREIVGAHQLIMSRAVHAWQEWSLAHGVARRSVDTPFFRFPFGSGWRVERLQQYLANHGLINFHWNMDSGDSPACGEADRTAGRCPRATVQSVYNTSIRYIERQRHGIFLAHDRSAVMATVVPRLLRYLIANDYTFVVFTP